jgi:hypothetical protein
MMNIDELDSVGNKICEWCFLPEGNLAAGDVMLAQKIALELQSARLARTGCTRLNTSALRKRFTAFQVQVRTGGPGQHAPERRPIAPDHVPRLPGTRSF